MSNRPTRPPADELERCAHNVAEGEHVDEAVEALALNAGLDPEQVEAAKQRDERGDGTIDARVVVLAIDRDAAAKLLPLGLELAPQPLTFPDKHPIFIMFARDGFDTWFGQMNYNEMTIAVPYVQRDASHVAHRGPFIYMPRTYVDSEAAQLFGTLLYGFEKQRAQIDNDAKTFVVRDTNGSVLAEAAFHAPDDPAGPPSAAPNFDEVRRVFDMPTISQALRVCSANAFNERDFLSPFLCTNIVNNFGDGVATVQPMRATINLSQAITPPGLPTGPLDVPSLSTQVMGAFGLKCPQSIALPGPCSETVFVSPSPPKKKRVMVLGGGPSALAAAYYLARQRDRFEVELYTLGWRLGGKCAAGRNPDAADRIEEHGLHAFVGFYENAFRTMRDVYTDAGLPIAVGKPPYDYDAGEGPYAAGFIGTEDVGVFEQFKGEWRYFKTPQTFNGEVPGLIPEGGDDPPGNFGRMVSNALRRVVYDTSTLLGVDRDDTTNHVEAFEDQSDEGFWSSLVDSVREAVDVGEGTVRDALEELVTYIEQLAIETISQQIEEGSRFFKGVAMLLRFVRAALRVVLRDEIENDPEIYFVWQGLDIVLTSLIGIIDAQTVNFDTLDGYDFIEWLLANGMDPRNKDASAVTSVYETLFAHGETPVPDRLAAGVGLRWFVLVGFLYRGYPASFFKYSCPQTMCTPYYIALRKLGAKVHFFHNVLDLDVEGEGDARRLRGVTMQVQATTKGGAEYDPFVHKLKNNPPDQPPWPTKPNFDQLEQGEELKRRGIDLENPWSKWEGVGKPIERRLGEDFDLCILGIPLSVFPAIATKLTDPQAPTYATQWRNMVDGMAVIRTISAQLWFQPKLDGLSKNPYGMLTSYAAPEPSLGNFSHLIEWEEWPRNVEQPHSLFYHTGSEVQITVAEGYPTSVGPEYPQREMEKWREGFAAWLETHYEGMYDSVANFAVLMNSLSTQQPAEGLERLRQQYFNISTHPSDHYVLSQPKAISLRLGQSESWVQGLFLCGDWTRTDLNCGCVEASTQSGMLVSRVLSNYPRYIWHPGF